MKLLKHTLILVVFFVVSACGNTKGISKMENNKNIETVELSGEYIISIPETTLDMPDKITLTFNKATGQVSGFAGCNNFFGAYTQAKSVLAFAEFGSTKKNCKRFMDVEYYIMKTLNGVTSFSVKNETVKFLKDDTILLEAKKFL